MEGFDPKAPSQGLGDTIAKITHSSGLDIVADKVAKAMGKDDCGCNRRREKLNKLVPFNNKPIPSVPLPSTFLINRNLSIQWGGDLVKYSKGEEVFVDENHPVAQSLNYFLKIGAIEVINKF